METREARVIDLFCEGTLKSRGYELLAPGLEMGGGNIFIPHIGS